MTRAQTLGIMMAIMKPDGTLLEGEGAHLARIADALLREAERVSPEPEMSQADIKDTLKTLLRRPVRPA